MMQLRSENIHLVPQDARHDCHPQHRQELCAVEIPNHRLRAQRCNVRLLQCQARQRQCQCRDACVKIQSRLWMAALASLVQLCGVCRLHDGTTRFLGLTRQPWQ